LTIGLSILLAVACAGVIYTYGKGPESKGNPILKSGAAVIGIPVSFFVIAQVLTRISEKMIEVGQLRMVIFAVTLIILMLLRPQGVFAHHEFSWEWLRAWLFDRKKSKEVTA
jgi:branched-chain amino acid transport system permease protein